MCSLTGEDTVEFHTHGSTAVIRAMLSAIPSVSKIHNNCVNIRPANPGEFAQTSFLNGKMDLAQAEQLVDLIDAETDSQLELAFKSTFSTFRFSYHHLLFCSSVSHPFVFQLQN